MTAVHLCDVTKRFAGHTAVDGLSLQVPAGAIYGFIGPNGSGKTTTIRMILHIFHPDSGTVEVLGQRGSRAANDLVGYLPEERGLYKKMSVRRVLAYYATLKGMSTNDAARAVDPWLERMGLAKWRDHKVEALSKGMAQKVQFISAVMAKPRLLILDEPFSGLDPVNMEALREAILDLNRQGTTVIFSTHDMEMAEKMCDFVFMIYKGKKVLDGAAAAIKQTYGTDTIRLRLDGKPVGLDRMEGVRGVRDLGQYQEVRFEGDSQRLLHALLSQTRVELFEVARPSLRDIFMRIARPGQPEENHV